MLGRLSFVVALALWVPLAASAGEANCEVVSKTVNFKTIRVIQCEETAEAMSAAEARARDACAQTLAESIEDCYEAVSESLRMRREAMLRRTLREGATAEAAAQMYGYTVEEVEQWKAENLITTTESDDQAGYAKAPAVEQFERDMAQAMVELDLSP